MLLLLLVVVMLLLLLLKVVKLLLHMMSWVLVVMVLLLVLVLLVARVVVLLLVLLVLLLVVLVLLVVLEVVGIRKWNHRRRATGDLRGQRIGADPVRRGAGKHCLGGRKHIYRGVLRGVLHMEHAVHPGRLGRHGMGFPELGLGCTCHQEALCTAHAPHRIRKHRIGARDHV
jgi:Ca2+/Na+ antiporter